MLLGTATGSSPFGSAESRGAAAMKARAARIALNMLRISFAPLARRSPSVPLWLNALPRVRFRGAEWLRARKREGNRSAPAIAEVPHFVAELAGLGLVTGFEPAAGAVLPAGG